MLLKENQIEGRYKPINSYNNIKIDTNLLDFIFQFCTVANLSRETAQGSVFFFEYFIHNIYDISKHDVQLIAMTCILVSSKMFDVKPLSMSTLHRISAFVYNNTTVLCAENIVLKMLNYDLFVRDRLIIDRVGLYLESARFLIDGKDFDKFSELCYKVSDLIFEDSSILKENEFSLLCAAVIQASIVIATRREGKLPITIRCILLNYFDFLLF